MRLLFTIGLLFLLGGCANYPTASFTADLTPAEDVAFRYGLNPAWWGIYADPDLDRLVATALERNADYARSAIAINRALYRARLLSADLVPSFSADASAGSTRALDNGNSSRSYASEFGVSYEVDLWQKLRNAADAQEWEYRATVLDRESARLALVNNVVDAYFDLRYLDQAIRVTEDSVERYGRLLELTRVRYELGKADSVEPLQAEQSLLAARTSLADLQTQRKQTEQTLRDLLDLRPAAALATGSGDLMTAKTAEVNLEVPVAALAARPDIQASDARLQSAFNTRESDRASWSPSITVGSTLRASSGRASNLFDVPFLAGTVKINFPFLQWNTIRWNIKISEADFEEARLDFTESVTTALNEVDTAYYAYKNSRRILEHTIAKHERDVRIGDYYQTRYMLGAAELKDYLDALNTADSSMLSALEAKYTTIRYENQIYKAMGGRYEPVRTH